jgi:hypothetical protein
VLSLSAQIADKDATIKTLSDDRDALKLSADKAEATGAITDALRTGRIAPADLDNGWEADPIKALSDAGFNGVAGFLAQMKRKPANSRVDLSAVKSGDATDSPLSLSDPAHPDILALSAKTGIKPEFLAKATSRIDAADKL